MARLLLYLSLFCLVLLGCDRPKTLSSLERETNVITQSSNEPFYIGGIHVNESSTENWLNTLEEVGMNTTEVTVYGKQWLWNTDDLEFDKDDEIQGQINEIRLAKKKGLKVVVILRTQLQHWFKQNRFLWHGMIMPKNDSLLLSWFEKYTAYNLKWAKICEEEGVDVMAIGSEMNALSSTMPLTSIPWQYHYYNSSWGLTFFEERILKYKKTLQDKHLWIQGYTVDKNGEDWLEKYVEDKITKFRFWGNQVSFASEENRLEKLNQRRALMKKSWVKLIQKVRTLYNGKLTYAANYDNYHEVDFWEHLDFIGINAYFPLRKPSDELPPTNELLANFEENWRNVFKEINSFKKKHHLSEKPLLFTELGYTNYLNATVESWSGSGFTILGLWPHEKLVVWKEQEMCSEERYLAIKALKNVFDSYPTNLQGILYWKLTTHEYLLREESFSLYIQNPPKDPLQDILTNFITKEPTTK
ncbi:MAG: glycoside hydrolase family 113 [Chitinophagales bacterium]